jgi:single-strand DNA-binding protein
MNKAIITGFLVNEVEENGKAYKFTISVSKDYKNNEGKYDKDFIRCVAFGITGEYIKAYSHKGDLIQVEGSNQTSKYEKDGKTLYNTEIMANKTRNLTNMANYTKKEERGLKTPKNELEENVKDWDIGF